MNPNQPAVLLAPLLIISSVAGCAGPETRQSGALHENDADGREATSLLGRPLYARLSTNEEDTDNATQALRAVTMAPNNAEAIVWYGRRLAYLGCFREAVEVYSQGLLLFPESHHLLRHRGHRLITLRQFDLAIADLDRAWELAREKPDAMEPDGKPSPDPNRLYFGPRSSDRGNIVYHLGLAYYLKGDYQRAAEWFGKRLDLPLATEDSTVASLYWQYISLRRLGRPDEASRLLENLPDPRRLSENGQYLALLWMYQGRLTPADLLNDPSRAQNPDPATPQFVHGSDGIRFGVAAWYDFEKGERDRCLQMCREIVDGGGSWASFGFIAAEAELARPR